MANEPTARRDGQGNLNGHFPPKSLALFSQTAYWIRGLTQYCICRLSPSKGYDEKIYYGIDFFYENTHHKYYKLQGVYLHIIIMTWETPHMHHCE